MLAWWLGRRSRDDWEHVRDAADFIVANGPETDQERWENQNGWSPNTIATEIAALVCAADIARDHGDDGARRRGTRRLADEWEQQRRGAGRPRPTARTPPTPYYLRVTKDGDPDDDSTYDLGDNFPAPVDEREIVDQSFLGLALFGVKRPTTATILNSLAVGDRMLSGDTPHGPVWHRFTLRRLRRDGVRRATGTSSRRSSARRFGRLWPLLAGERGEYELLAGRSAAPHLATIAGAANDGLMLPEQVWDGRPPTGQPGFQAGEGTRRRRRWRGRTRSSSGWRGRSTRARRSSSRRGGLPLPGRRC